MAHVKCGFQLGVLAAALVDGARAVIKRTDERLCVVALEFSESTNQMLRRSIQRHINLKPSTTSHNIFNTITMIQNLTTRLLSPRFRGSNTQVGIRNVIKHGLRRKPCMWYL
ncbi:hypothetical protein BDR26DRAFT_850642, partial [Obelidium mucronatum]